MIFSRSPMSRSGADPAIPSTCPAMRNRIANAPNHGQRPAFGGTHGIGDEVMYAVSWRFRTSILGLRSCFNHMLERKMRCHKKDDVVRAEKLDPGVRLVHEIA